VSDLSPPELPAIERLNGLQFDQFGVALRPLFEAAAPLASALYGERPFDSYARLIERAESLALHALPRAEQIEVLNAHPAIGERPALLSALSFREQGHDRQSGSSAEEREGEELSIRLAELNRAYEASFGFRFVVFVNKRPKSEIATVLEQRLKNDDGDQELSTGLHEMFSIARDRLRTLQ
jgi:2-oxo-4-hydroxy-4-carboxy--5-ureidoimidazoline (OHCU) decarboxylase